MKREPKIGDLIKGLSAINAGIIKKEKAWVTIVFVGLVLKTDSFGRHLVQWFMVSENGIAEQGYRDWEVIAANNRKFVDGPMDLFKEHDAR